MHILTGRVGYKHCKCRLGSNKNTVTMKKTLSFWCSPTKRQQPQACEGRRALCSIPKHEGSQRENKQHEKSSMASAAALSPFITRSHSSF